jgi:hypothetical protein
MELSNMKQLLIATSLIGILLGGCATMSRQEQIQLAYQQCPVLKKYSKEQLMKAAGELKALATDSEIAEMVTDYSKLREACRLAEKKLKKPKAK